MYTYKDFESGKIKSTRGEFIGWTGPKGPVDAKYAIFKNPKGAAFIPDYLLTMETMQALEDRSDTLLQMQT